VILVAALATLIVWHGHSGKAEATSTLTVGMDYKVNQSDAGTYGSTLPAFENCVDVKTSVNSFFYFDMFVLNAVNLAGYQADFTFTSGTMQLMEANAKQFFGNSSSVSTYLTSAGMNPSPTVSSAGVINPAVNNGHYEVTVVDTGSGHTGSGVLMRFKAQAFIGPSVINYAFDINPGVSHGVTLTDIAAAHPGDTNSDSFFDGPFINTTGKIAVDQPDGDSDGVSNTCDNCPTIANGAAQAAIVGVGNQTDTDGDGQGDACDSDDDADGVPDSSDNCPRVYNPAQNASACADTDSDGILDGVDNCPTTSNANQANNDGDSMGDACDPDDDNDGVNDGPDNCDFIANPTQADFNSNGVGDACQDSDNDGWLDAVDNCKGLANPSQTNPDNDLYGSICDNCPSTSNTSAADLNPDGTQKDQDADFIGDACDDGDADTYMDKVEVFTGTSTTLKCSADETRNNEAIDTLPTDNDDNRLVNGQDILKYNLYFGTVGPNPPYQKRYDINMDNIINGQDILKFNLPFGKFCYQL
jgi:hypothetical protein